MDGSRSALLQPVSLKPRRIVVLAGGDSAERQISLNSGTAVTAALQAQGHAVRMVDPSATVLEAFDWSAVDVAFLALHGAFGEDGGVQQILERIGVPFTGSDAAASRLAFSKSAAKERFRSCGVPTPDYTLIHASDDRDRVLAQIDTIGLPLVIKPDAQGSSIGVSMVRSAEAVTDGIAACFKFDSFGLVERAIEGCEWTLGVIDEDPLPLIQIGTSRAFFDFEAKYQDDGTRYNFDAIVDDAERQRITDAGLAACRAIGTRGIARVDIMVDASGQPWVLEVNTIPGMTDHSLVPKAAARAGLDMGQLCDLAIARALNASASSLRRAS